MDALFGLLGLAILIIGLGLLIRPVGRLGIPTRRRAAAVAGTGLALFIVGLFIHAPKPPASAQQAVVQPAAASAPAAKPSLTVQRLGELVEQADPWTIGVLKTMLGGIQLEIRQDDSQGIVIAVAFDNAFDGPVAESVGTSIVKMAVEELVAVGANPRLQKRVVQASVYTLDVPASVTGAKQYRGYGVAVYSPQSDKIEWRPANGVGAHATTSQR